MRKLTTFCDLKAPQFIPDLNEKLDFLDKIHQEKYYIVYALAEAALDKRFTNSLKSQDSFFNENFAAFVVDVSHTVETCKGLK